MNKKIWRVMFKVSFIPYILIFVFALTNSFTGTSFITSKIYGYEAFLMTIIAGFITGSPIFISCAIYQIIYMANTGVFKSDGFKKFLKYRRILVLQRCEYASEFLYILHPVFSIICYNE